VELVGTYYLLGRYLWLDYNKIPTLHRKSNKFLKKILTRLGFLPFFLKKNIFCAKYACILKYNRGGYETKSMNVEITVCVCRTSTLILKAGGGGRHRNPVFFTYDVIVLQCHFI